MSDDAEKLFALKRNYVQSMHSVDFFRLPPQGGSPILSDGQISGQVLKKV